MDQGKILIVALLAVVGGNHLLNRTAWIAKPAIFWGMQAINVAFALGLMVYEIPGFGRVPAMRLVLGMMFFMRIVHNWRVRLVYFQRLENEAIEREDRERLAEMERLADLERSANKKPL